jgi:hypothetical protein
LDKYKTISPSFNNAAGWVLTLVGGRDINSKHRRTLGMEGGKEGHFSMEKFGISRVSRTEFLVF